MYLFPLRCYLVLCQCSGFTYVAPTGLVNSISRHIFRISSVSLQYAITELQQRRSYLDEAVNLYAICIPWM